MIEYLLSHILCYIHPPSSYTTYTHNQQKTQAPPKIFQNLTGYPTQPNPQNPQNSTPSTASWPCFRSTPRVAISRSHFRGRNIRRARNGNPSPPGWSLPRTQPTPWWRCFKVYAFLCYPGLAQKKVGCGFWERINYNFWIKTFSCYNGLYLIGLFIWHVCVYFDFLYNNFMIDSMPGF